MTLTWKPSLTPTANINNNPVRNAEPEYLLFKGSYHHTSVFEDRSQLKFTFNAQYTHSSLLSSVLFSYGGMGIGKAYDGSTVNGDSGYSVGLELVSQQDSYHPF